MVVFGSNIFLGFMPVEAPTGDMGSLMELLWSLPFLKIIGVIEVGVGVLLLFNKYVPLALTFLIAVLLNAALFHLFFDNPGNVVGAKVFLIISLVLVYANKDRFSSLLSA